MRLNTFIARTGLCSRRKADDLIEKGKIAVNGRTVTTLGFKIDPEKDRVTCRGRELTPKDRYTYIMLNKPKECITTARDERGRETVLDLLPGKLREKRLFPIGRLDKDTTGILLLTDDGVLANRLMHPRGQIEKTYRVGINRVFKKEHIEELTCGIREGDDLLVAKKVLMLDDSVLEVTLAEGKKREIKRMFGKLGYGVSFIRRIRYAFLTVEGLEEGRYRELTEKEINRLKNL